MEVTERKAAVPDLDALAQLVGGVRSPAWPDGLCPDGLFSPELAGPGLGGFPVPGEGWTELMCGVWVGSSTPLPDLAPTRQRDLEL